MQRFKPLGLFLGMAVALVATASSAQDGSTRKGVTWAKYAHKNGVDWVYCHNDRSGSCDAYAGDTNCSTRLPVLCLKKDGAPVPSGVDVNFYHGWAAGNIALTHAVRGDSMRSLAEANAVCRSQLGPGYEVAEHHDGGGGWGWQAYGNIDDTTRFWVHVKNQPSACWQP